MAPTRMTDQDVKRREAAAAHDDDDDVVEHVREPPRPTRDRIPHAPRIRARICGRSRSGSRSVTLRSL